MTSLRLISLNIEYTRHFDLIIPFLEKYQPDVFCAQELCEQDIPLFEKALNARCVFAPMTRLLIPEWTSRRIVGVGTFSRFPILQHEAQYYIGTHEFIPEHNASTLENQRKTVHRPILTARIQKEQSTFAICNTHFTWTPDGEATDGQREDAHAMLAILRDLKEFILCGDFNAPRGGEIFKLLSTTYNDNVPQQYATSLDRTLHRAGHLDRMVDGLFSTQEYTVSDVSMICGVSDHCALSAIVTCR